MGSDTHVVKPRRGSGKANRGVGLWGNAKPKHGIPEGFADDPGFDIGNGGGTSGFPRKEKGGLKART